MVKEIAAQALTENSLSALRQAFWKQELNLEITTENQLTDSTKDNCQAIFLDDETALELIRQSSSLRTEVIETQHADLLVLAESRWWLYSYLSEALSILMVRKAPSLNTHRKAYITGDNFYSRMAAATAIKLGFENIVFVAENPDVFEDQIASLKRKFFGLKLEVIRESELTLQSSNGSLLINTVSEAVSKTIIEDLTYLNFLEKKSSVIVEIPFSSQNNTILEEAKHAQIAFVSSSELWAFRDYLVLKNLRFSSLPSWEQYFQKWEVFLQARLPQNPP